MTGAPARRVPPGCCPGCLMEHATEPCGLHRAAGDLLAALRYIAGFGPAAVAANPTAIIKRARAALAQAEGRGS